MSLAPGRASTVRRWEPMGTRPSGATLMSVRTLQTKGHQGQHGTGRMTERFLFEPASRPAGVSSGARDGFRVGCDGDEGLGYEDWPGQGRRFVHWRSRSEEHTS